MQKYKYIFFICFICLSNIVTVFIVDKFYIPKVKTISLIEIINDKEDKTYQAFLDGKLTKEEYSSKLDQKMEAIQEAIEQLSNGKDILIAEEAVIKTEKNNYISLTSIVKNYVDQYQNSISK